MDRETSAIRATDKSPKYIQQRVRHVTTGVNATAHLHTKVKQLLHGELVQAIEEVGALDWCFVMVDSVISIGFTCLHKAAKFVQ